MEPGGCGARAEVERPEVHVWLARDPEIDADLLEAYRGLVTPEERARGERFRFERHRRQFWVTRALVRTTLSRYFDVEPNAWRFEPNEHGRPEVTAPCSVEGLSFNLSHTDGLVACAVTWGAVIGCDVENLERQVEIELVARRFFAAPEVRVVRASPTDLQMQRFLEFWTLKESYLKARGTGLRLPLQEFAFELGAQPGASGRELPEQIAITFHGIEDDPARWRFAMFRPDPSHLLALAVDAPDEVPIRIRECVPLRHDEDRTLPAGPR